MCPRLLRVVISMNLPMSSANIRIIFGACLKCSLQFIWENMNASRLTRMRVEDIEASWHESRILFYNVFTTTRLLPDWWKKNETDGRRETKSWWNGSRVKWPQHKHIIDPMSRVRNMKIRQSTNMCIKFVNLIMFIWKMTLVRFRVTETYRSASR